MTKLAYSNNNLPVYDSISTSEGYLHSISRWIAESTIRFIEWFISLLGLRTEVILDSTLGNTLLASTTLFVLLGAIVWICRLLLYRYIRSHHHTRHYLIIRSLVKPFQFQVWIIGGYAAISPILIYLTERYETTLLLSTVHFLVSGSLFISVAWFLNTLLLYSRANIEKFFRDKGNVWGEVIIPSLIKSLRVTIPLLATILFIETISISEGLQTSVSRISSILLITIVFWVLTQIVLSFDDIILKKYKITDSDNLKARRIYTQVAVIQRICLVMIGFLSFASILLLFPNVRQFGQTILASAGVAGLVIGFAMQRTLSNLFAGIQIAFTQPIRIDDVVIVENEWGWIEEITLTYVVVKIWDWRRLVLPISYFIEHPFQNWTRTNASIIGSVVMHVDYRIDIPDLRAAMEKEVKKHSLWDGRVYCLQVIECRERTVEVRVLLSAADSPKAWDLRCDIREAMLSYIQNNHPQCLPQIRIGPQMPPHGKEREPSNKRTGEAHHLDLEQTAAAE
ncbi:mechanosensitive ion channel family protein [Chitinispirillales bacterium ANBcel5]|uniref:mechanosensitive ion channel family protein n=1 Tax=Cellulosispirillum alkaliphilum TaxID=3039283 RepID=UPI002A5636CC|nr:mechanosensitive ion channel family protein [Chitinispirillales bacterium ANBcel5]